jgi:phenylalanyl-tRNA synthetase beta chain
MAIILWNQIVKYLFNIIDPTFFPDRSADIFYQGVCIGCFGILHPTVLANFELNYPASAIEFSLEEFLE